MVPSIQHENVELNSNDSDIEAKVLSFVSQSLKENWVKTDLSIKQLTDGLSNILFAIRSSETNGVILKIYGRNSDLIVDRQAEIRLMTHLAKYHLSPPILLTFNNGFVYQYVPGEPIIDRDDEKKALLIARTLAELHSVPLIDEKQEGQLVEKLRHYINLLIGVNDELYKRIQLSASPFLNDIPWSKLKEDIDRIAEVFNGEKWKALRVVTCHNDTQTLNFLISDEANLKVSIIDFEHGARNIWLFDVFNYFVEFAGVESEEPDYEKSYPTREKRKQWLEVYLSHATFDNQEQMSTEELCDLGDRLRAPIHLYWALWAFLEALLNPESMQKFDYVKYGRCRLVEYEKLKDQFFSSV